MQTADRDICSARSYLANGECGTNRGTKQFRSIISLKSVDFVGSERPLPLFPTRRKSAIFPSIVRLNSENLSNGRFNLNFATGDEFHPIDWAIECAPSSRFERYLDVSGSFESGSREALARESALRRRSGINTLGECSPVWHLLGARDDVLSLA